MDLHARPLFDLFIKFFAAFQILRYLFYNCILSGHYFLSLNFKAVLECLMLHFDVFLLLFDELLAARSYFSSNKSFFLLSPLVLFRRELLLLFVLVFVFVIHSSFVITPKVLSHVPHYFISYQIIIIYHII